MLLMLNVFNYVLLIMFLTYGRLPKPLAVAHRVTPCPRAQGHQEDLQDHLQDLQDHL